VDIEMIPVQALALRTEWIAGTAAKRGAMLVPHKAQAKSLAA